MHAFIWNNTPKHKLPNTQYTVKCISTAARETCLWFPELGVQIDAGLPHEYFVPDTKIFITHSHRDHCQGLSSVLIEGDKTKPTIYVPKPALDYIKASVVADMRATKFTDAPKILKHLNFVGVELSKTYDIKLINRRWTVYPLKCFHTVPCTGYGFKEWRERLKREYFHMKDDKTALGTLKKSGVDISEFVELPIFATLGDTNHFVFYLDDKTTYNPDMFKYPIIIVECTYINDSEIKKAKDDKHMHWINLEKVIKDHPENHFMLMHFSQRYTTVELEEFFSKVSYPNITPMISKLVEKPIDSHCDSCCCERGEKMEQSEDSDDFCEGEIIVDYHLESKVFAGAG